MAKPHRRAPSVPTAAERAAATGARTEPGIVRRFTDVAYQRGEASERVVHASNWRTPIIIDLVLGTIVFAVGFVLAVNWSPIPGGGIAALGLLYDSLAIRRWRKWAAVRHRGETDTD